MCLCLFFFLFFFCFLYHKHNKHWTLNAITIHPKIWKYTLRVSSHLWMYIALLYTYNAPDAVDDARTKRMKKKKEKKNTNKTLTHSFKKFIMVFVGLRLWICQALITLYNCTVWLPYMYTPILYIFETASERKWDLLIKRDIVSSFCAPVRFALWLRTFCSRCIHLALCYSTILLFVVRTFVRLFPFFLSSFLLIRFLLANVQL